MAKPSQKIILKKPSLSVDSTSVRLRDGLHLKILRRCRHILLKDLDPADLLELISVDDAIRPEVRDSILACKSREERASFFLDRLERANENTFLVFLDALRDRYRHLHSLLEEMIKSYNGSDDEENTRERTVIAGDVLRKLLKDSTARRRFLNGGSDSRSDPSLLDEEVAHTEENQNEEDEEYLNCYVVSTRGKLQQEKWIKHACSQKDEDALVEPNSGRTYMAVVTKDLVFRLMDPSALPDLIKQPPKQCMQMYVIDEDSKYTPASTASTDDRTFGCRNGLDLSFRSKKCQVSRSKYAFAETDGTYKSYRDVPLASSSAGCFPAGADPIPPPLPPKPDNLPQLGLFPADRNSNEKSCSDQETCENKADDAEQTGIVLMTPLLDDQAPPLPLRIKRSSGVRQRRQSAENCPVKHDERISSAETIETGPITTGLEQEIKEEEADDISLNFNIEPEDEEEICDGSDDEEDPYEAVNHPDGLIGQKSVESETTASPASTKSDPEKPQEGVEVETDTDTICSNVTLKEDLSRQNSKTPTIPSPRQPEATITEAPTDTRLNGRVSPESFPGKGNARDSGVDSVVSQGFPDSPFSVDAAEPDVFSSCNLDDLKVLLTDDEKSSTDYSYYEDIELLNVRHSPSLYLNPCANQSSHKRNTIRSPYGRTAEYPFTSSSQKVLPCGSLLIAETEDACLFSGLLEGCTVSSEFQENTNLISNFKGTVLGYDKDGLVYYVPTDALKQFGNPEDEDWFYPIELTSRQATLFLKKENQMGCFVVYRPRNPNLGVLYNLSVCRGIGGEVVHYHIVENVRGDVMIEGHDHSFMSVGELVSYFRRNQSHLATRLRRPLKDARLPITPGYHYPERYEIPRRDIQLNSTVLGQDKCGVLCRGQFNGSSVSVKIFQTNEGVIDDDNFLEEVQLHMSLRHENIIRLLGVCCRTKPFYMVTECADKETLAECLQNNSIRLDCVEDLFDVCMQTVAAMTYLESRRFVLHRALSTKNILVTNDMLVKIANFDRARFVLDDNYLACFSEEVPVRWASPEVLTRSCYSTKSDIWALGVVFWEVFSGAARPYHKLTDEEVAVFVTEGGRLDRPTGCTHDLFALMKRCWKHLPSDRPSFSAIHEKLKGNSSIYYTSSSSNQTSSAAQGSLKSSNVPLLPMKVKGSAPSKVGTPTVTSKWRHTTASRESTRSADGVLKMILESGKDATTKSNRHQRASGDLRLPAIQLTAAIIDRPLTSSSDSSSVVSASVCNDFDKEDLTRGDKIRKSIRKFIKGKKTAK